MALNIKTMRATTTQLPLRRRASIIERFRGWITSHQRTHFGLKRRTAFIGIVVFCVLLFCLIVGLAVGLGKRSKFQNLPLPSNKETFKGDLTYYSPALGACGVTSSPKEDICAVSHVIFDAAKKGSNPNANPLCGLRIRATRYNEDSKAQRSVDLTVVDRCVGCKATDIDLSPAAFKKLANPDLGRVAVTWAWLN